jgi:hypothetical protein
MTGVGAVFSVAVLAFFGFFGFVAEFSLGNSILNASSLLRVCDLRPIVLRGF